mgnify:CR=1 FL=1
MSSGPLTVSAFIQNVSHMYCGQKLSERIYWTGVYDRRKHLFENMWPLPEGVSYNSYLIKDEKCALMDTVESGSDRSYLDWLAGRYSIDAEEIRKIKSHKVQRTRDRIAQEAANGKA